MSSLEDLIVLFFIFMIIAIPCLLCGESDDLHIKSYSMRKYIGKVYKNHIFETDEIFGDNIWFKGSCFYKYDGDRICEIRELYRKQYRRHSNVNDDDGITKTAAIIEINERCPINSTRTVYYDIRNGECNIINSYKDIANTGIVFMVFGAIILFFTMTIYILGVESRRQWNEAIRMNQITASVLPTVDPDANQNLPTKILFELITPETDQECMICLEKNKIDWVKTVCGHEFHRKCIIESSSYKRFCPECRQNMFSYNTCDLKVTKPTPNTMITTEQRPTVFNISLDITNADIENATVIDV